ncbi:ABC transporter substrate-binding protein [Halanaerobium sp. MA284_MarDTE_T2]|uniref:ABC transporter substrate-binding protein n=1 Tax=Halanaerobium sp. MA284_MarDTE_T2 TaxID=2183913 RepID=UPI000DF30B67|nr:ABC transporter substrate-binding protein [Halanaerobium sp. MA284_MarDTE_T2]RCW40671.1 NitT/TauT family transport system substrate-binding protein [Halanaerobium sp. MA284_MarDTE_T2]
MKKSLIFIMLIFLMMPALNFKAAAEDIPINIAVEFMDHAASFFVAENKGWFEEYDLNISSFDTYSTGMALSAALSRGDVNAAYICLVPAVTAFANGKVPIKIVAGTHKYGYGILVNSEYISIDSDLEKEGIAIGCPREGSPADLLLHKFIEEKNLNKEKVMKNIRRMSPNKILLSIKNNKIQAGVMPEQYPSMGEKMGFKILINAKELWPEMQGSVLVVTEDLIKKDSKQVKKLVEINRRSIQFVKDNPEEASVIVSEALQAGGESYLMEDNNKNSSITPDIIKNSIEKELEFTTEIDADQVQSVVNYMSDLGYIEKFDVKEILDLRYLHNE